MPPKPPHHRHPKPPHPHVKPPHRGKKGQSTRLLASIIVGIGITSVVAAVMWSYGIPINTILPTSAPILIGAITLAFMAQSQP